MLRIALVLWTSLIASCVARRAIVTVDDLMLPPEYPRLHVIGNNPVVTFDKTVPTDVVIPIRGFALQSAEWTAHIVGTVPIRRDHNCVSNDDPLAARRFAVYSISDHSAELRISHEYFKKTSDLDRLAVTLSVADLTTNEELRVALMDLKVAEKKQQDAIDDVGSAHAQLTAAKNSKTDKTDELQKKCEICERRVEAASRSVEARRKKAETLSRKLPRHQPQLERHFVLRATTEFRSVLRESVSYDDIRAFPMSEVVARDVFGAVVAKNYLVVAVRLYNRSDMDRVVTVGMITARGQALVVPPVPSNSESPPAFNVPVAVSPARSSLVYSHVADEQTNEPRNVVFRTMKFVGAVATALVSPFDLTDDFLKGVSIFTGILIPEGEKLWPERVGGNLRNLVTFGFPDVIKVPKGASAGGVLFFPKNELHSLVTAAEYFELYKSRFGRFELEHPAQFVAGLEVNSMDILFENTVNPNEIDALKERLSRAAGAADNTAITDVAQRFNDLKPELVVEAAAAAKEFAEKFLIAAEPASKLRTSAETDDGTLADNVDAARVAFLSELAALETALGAETLTKAKAAVDEAQRQASDAIGAYEVATGAGRDQAERRRASARLALEAAVAKYREELHRKDGETSVMDRVAAVEEAKAKLLTLGRAAWQRLEKLGVTPEALEQAYGTYAR